MTVIRATMKDHGGYTDVQSKEGEGTKITLYLQTTREVVDSNSRRMMLEGYLGTEKILIGGEMPEQVEIASKMLTKLGGQHFLRVQRKGRREFYYNSP